MRGMTSKDGKMSGNRQMVSRYDDTRGKGSAGATERPRAGHAESGGAHMGAGGPDQMKHIVGEHGLAMKHTITKDEDGAGFHSETEHEDGHLHDAHHDSLEEAHEHGKEAMEDAEHNELDRDSQMTAGHKDAFESSPRKSSH